MRARIPPTAPVVGLCLMALVLEGYDLLMYGTVVPSLLQYTPWDLDATDVGMLGSLTGIGMLVGALLAAAVADRWGRRRTLLAAVVMFSTAMGACAIAPTPEVFGAGRFAVGLGAGVLMPTAAATLLEFAEPRARARSVAVGFVGTCIGGILAGVLSLWLVPTHGFRSMFLAGIVPALMFLPLMLAYLPESPDYLASRGEHAAAAAIADRYRLARTAAPTFTTPSRERGLRALFGIDRTVTTLLFWCMTLLCLLVLFGVATWLPALMKSAGYPLGASLSFLLTLNIGGALGALGGAVLADRYGIKPVTAAFFLCAAIALLLVTTAPPLAVVYLLVLLAGVGTTGTQILLNTFIGSSYPATSRATGLGMALGVGRIGAIVGPTYGGVLVAIGTGTNWQLVAFAAPAVVGAILTVLVPQRTPIHRFAQTQRPSAAANVDRKAVS
ncbi:amino acid transporter [Rhodococcus sp. SC4]|uniref:MFS transporter n=1 Tax=Rhodococcus sp. LB1 TaxID=1807499 RepID=UPI00076ACE39|nr:MFS transporter [Rhodococcus sp. LB1]KXF48927.1 amino acid transporter [Rhodococcus sp. SC4]KXX59486.1 amino acid transporter [Rhodococcus sp. LB1]RZK72498.1 MAG: MFS transporter [Rhodococcus sp. (in: high G+C Gram-positive bacteria)]